MLCCIKTFVYLNSLKRTKSPALAERNPPDKRPQTAVETDGGRHAEDLNDPDG